MKHSPEKSRNSLEEAKAAGPPAERGISRWKLALGAASLFFFVVGVKRSFRTDDGREILQSDADLLDEEREELKLTTRNEAGRTAGRAPSNRSRPATNIEPGSRSAAKTEAASRKARKAGPSSRPVRRAEASSRTSTTTDRDSDDDPRRSRAPHPGRGDPDPEKRRRR